MKKIIENTVQTLGVMQNYSGYRYIVMAIEIIIEDEDNLRHITANIYSKIAAYYECSVCCVERNIRTVRDNIWKYHSAQLSNLVNFDITYQPSVSEFLGILYNYVIRHSDVV